MLRPGSEDPQAVAPQAAHDGLDFHKAGAPAEMAYGGLFAARCAGVGDQVSGE
jgi:hypothetical protein